MSNPRYNSQAPRRGGNGGKGTAEAQRGRPVSATVAERSPSWGGLPGPTQPRARNAGVRAVKTYPQSKGL